MKSPNKHIKCTGLALALIVLMANAGIAQTYWWKAPHLKYTEVMDDGTHGVAPHFWSFGGPSKTDASGDQTYLYTADSNKNAPFSQYAVADLRKAENPEQVSPRWFTVHIDKIPKGNAQFGNRLVMGNGGEENVQFISYPDDYTLGDKYENYLNADVFPNCDTLRFSHDGKYLYTDHYLGAENRMKLHRYMVGSLEADGTAFKLDTTWQSGGTFNTSLARLRNFTLRYIGGKDLIYYGEGDKTSKPLSVYVFDPSTGKETQLIKDVFQTSEVSDADIVNVKVAGVVKNDIHLYVMANIGGLKVYKLSADGLSVENSGKPVAVFTVDTLNTLTNSAAFSNHCRAFEVTDDQEYAFFSSHDANANIFVVNTAATLINDWKKN